MCRQIPASYWTRLADSRGASGGFSMSRVRNRSHAGHREVRASAGRRLAWRLIKRATCPRVELVNNNDVLAFGISPGGLVDRVSSPGHCCAEVTDLALGPWQNEVLTFRMTADVVFLKHHFP